MRPTALLAALAQFLIPNDDHEIILGDLEELYARRRAERGKLDAELDYLRSTLLSTWVLRMRSRRTRQVKDSRPWVGAVAEVRDDLRYVIRRLHRRGGFASAVVVTLALGIGSATAVFGMVNQLVLRPLPGADHSERAAYLFLAPDARRGLSVADFNELKRRATLLDGIASFSLTTQNVSLGAGRPVAIRANTYYGDFFEVLGVQPSAGRMLTGADSDLNADPLVAVISANLRDRLLSVGDDVVGRTLQMNGHPVEIVGVAPDGFRGPERGVEVDAWLPYGAVIPLVGLTRERLVGRGSEWHREFLILPRAGVSLGAVEEQVAQVLSQLADGAPEEADHLSELAPETYAGLQTPPRWRDVTNRTLGMMAWAAVLILAISWANVANLLLFQNLAQRGSLATARVLGASTARLTRLHVVESLILGVAGGLAGIGVAWSTTFAFRGESLVRMPAFEGFTLDASTALFVLGVSVLSALAFGAVPAALAGRFDLGVVLRSSGNRDRGRIGSLRTMLATGQIGLTLALLTGGLLMVRTVTNLRSLDTGLSVDDVAMIYLQVPDGLDMTDQHLLQRRLVEAVESVPGVERAAIDRYGPHGSSFRTPVAQPGRLQLPGPTTSIESLAVGWGVSPSWFEVFGVAPIHGRTLQDDDWRVPSTGAAVLTASLARRIFGRTDVVGQTVAVQLGREPTEKTVVGVVGDYLSLASPDEPTDAVFFPSGELQDFQMSVVAKLSPSNPEAAQAARVAVESVMPDSPVPEPVSLTDRVEQVYGEERLLGRLLVILSGFGLLLSAVGLFGAIFFMVKQRQREFGIRRAVGADSVSIVGLVARAALVMVVGGTTLGFLSSFGLARVLQSRLFGVGSFDSISYLGAATIVAAAAVVACLAPTRSALGADPVAVIREQ